jgi:hypothetical protein
MRLAPLRELRNNAGTRLKGLRTDLVSALLCQALTADRRAACRTDAILLCSWAIPNKARMANCLASRGCGKKSMAPHNASKELVFCHRSLIRRNCSFWSSRKRARPVSFSSTPRMPAALKSVNVRAEPQARSDVGAGGNCRYSSR